MSTMNAKAHKSRSGLKVLFVLLGLGSAAGIAAFTTLQPTLDASDSALADEPDWVNDGTLDAALERANRLSAETWAIADALNARGTRPQHDDDESVDD